MKLAPTIFKVPSKRFQTLKYLNCPSKGVPITFPFAVIVTIESAVPPIILMSSITVMRFQ